MNAQQECALSPSQTDTTAVELGSDPDPQPGGNGLTHLGIEDPRLVHIPNCTGAFVEDPGDSGGVPMVENSALPPLADPDGAASTFAAETADADTDVPNPRTLAEAQRSPNRPPWEDPITCKACPAMQELSQMGGVDIDDPNYSDHRGHTVHPLQPVHIDAAFPCYQLANHDLPPSPVDHLVCPLTDPALASAAECTITHDVPHCKAVNTCTWAALPMRLATTFTDANSSIAVHWCATLGHTFPIDSGTTPPFSKQQEAAPLPTIVSRHIAATEASCPHNPISGAFANPNAPTPMSSNNHTAIAFKCNHPSHPPDPLGHQEHKPPSSCAVDDMVADAPTPLLPAEEKHFAASPGPCVK